MKGGYDIFIFRNERSSFRSFPEWTTTLTSIDSQSSSSTTQNNGHESMKMTHPNVKPGPDPTLISRRQVDALYDILSAVTRAFHQLDIPYILTGGSLLGAVRQHSILFCDDDIDLAILGDKNYERVVSELPLILGDAYQYSIRCWEGGDKVRLKECSNVFLDVFVIRKYHCLDELKNVIGIKKNGELQSEEYLKRILNIIYDSLHSEGEVRISNTKRNDSCSISFPIWHFNTRKAIELWPKEVYRESELYPIVRNLKMGPVIGLSGPCTPVQLLKRAFGDDCFHVYYQSMSHGCNKILERDGNKTLRGDKSNKQQLPPHVHVGGQWSQSSKTPLLDEHYIPMQSMSKAKRRHTLHNKSRLFSYLECQIEFERSHLKTQGSQNFYSKSMKANVDNRPRKTVYMDGVFDLFHIGHLNAIEQCATLGDRVIIGVTGDQDASGYKRQPIINEVERTAIVKALYMVDDVVCPCPLTVTKEFMETWDIDLVVHGFADKKDRDKQIKDFFSIAVNEQKFQEIEYNSKLSTTDIIRRIKSSHNDCDLQEHFDVPKKDFNPKWFGSVLADASQYSPNIPFDPFPIQLRNSIEPHLQKARDKQALALKAVRYATGSDIYDSTLLTFFNCGYSKEGEFMFDTKEHLIRENFLKACELDPNFDLEQFHKSSQSKDEILFNFAENRSYFQEDYDNFVREVCVPFLSSIPDDDGAQHLDEFYYQSFPCVRVIQPGEFSIGPHGDASYGHHPCSINFYIPLTKIKGSASLFLETRPGSEDWHPIIGNYGLLKYFAGALCCHFTPENHGDFTRFSLDFRVIPGPFFDTLKCGGSRSGGVRDVYREKKGYYSRCYKQVKENSDPIWVREGPIQPPDARYGFPWTKVKSLNN